MNNSQKHFISSIVKAIGDKCNKAKILNSVVIAQAILETGWGTSELYKKYKELAEKKDNVIFGGRLGEYKYYDMDQVIAAALEMANRELN